MQPPREHYLYKVHNEFIIEKNDTKRAQKLFHIELERVADLDERIEKIEEGSIGISILNHMMRECVDAEIVKYILEDDMDYLCL